MIPLRDINPTRRFPIITITLIATNFLIFVYELSLSDQALGKLFFSAGVIPQEITHNFGPSAACDLITAMFLHGGWVHLLSNMLYLWIFGNNIEDELGPLRFTFYYLL
jgi:membrane associated rhomboid family serine protease